MMKKLTVLFAGLLIAAATFAQNDAVIDRLFDKYANQRGFVTVKINGSLLGFLAALDDESDKELETMSEAFSSIRILAVEDDYLNEELNFYEEIIDELDLNNYEEFMTVTSYEANVKMLIRGDSERIVEFLMIVGGEDNALIHITGNMGIDDIKAMASSSHINGIDALKHLEEIEK